MKNEQDLYAAQLDLFLDPSDPAVIAAARQNGIAEDWLDAARRSPVYALTNKYRLALPLHPEYRTMPMVWYIPPLSPVVDLLRDQGHDAEDHRNLFGVIDALRIPVEYLAELFTAGDTDTVTAVLRRMAAMRSYMRGITLGQTPDESIPASVGMTGPEMYEMYRLLGIAKYNERYVIPTAQVERAHELEELGCSLDYDEGPGMYGMQAAGRFGEASGHPVPVAVETFHALKQRQQTEGVAHAEEMRGRVNLLNWDGRGTPEGIFPPRRTEEEAR
jgi:nitrate reductase / nitrite oxidoreductase, beta subunit